MAISASNFKKTLSQKFNHFQKNGLEKYSKYLDQQLKIANKSESKVAYKIYIEKEIASTSKKLKSLEEKLK
jgi:hypothetical protein